MKKTRDFSLRRFSIRWKLALLALALSYLLLVGYRFGNEYLRLAKFLIRDIAFIVGFFSIGYFLRNTGTVFPRKPVARIWILFGLLPGVIFFILREFYLFLFSYFKGDLEFSFFVGFFWACFFFSFLFFRDSSKVLRKTIFRVLVSIVYFFLSFGFVVHNWFI